MKDVGERRERYGVTVPSAGAERQGRRGGGDKEQEEKISKDREAFLSALKLPNEEDGHGLSLPVVSTLRRWVSPAPFDKATSLLPRQDNKH